MIYRISQICKCIKRNPRQKLFGKASRTALNEIDFFNILKKIQEIEKLKLVLLSPQQIQLFNLLSKPMIFEEDQMSDIMKNSAGFKISAMIENSNLATDNILEFYKNIKQEKACDIDERLVNLIDKSLEDFMKYNKKKEKI